MSDTPLSPGVPGQIADLFDKGEITWTTGWGDYKNRTCPHGALLRPCAEPGDEIMWSILLSARGLTMGWNDRQKSASTVIDRLRHEADPDDAEMVRVFGSNWKAARTICRQYASATAEQREALRAAWAAWDARDAWAAWDARDARDAFFATIAVQWIDPSTAWTQQVHDDLIAPWVSVFGEPEVEL